MPFSYDYKIPLAIGLTGHRDIDPDDPVLVNMIRSELQKLQKDYAETPFIIISPLAEGADRLVVKLAQECLQAPRLIVPLPLPVEMYRQDFITAESKAEFDELLQSADVSFVLQLPVQVKEIEIHGEARNQQYAKVGAYVVEHSQILLAIWDGQQSKGTGGTAQVVSWARERRIPTQFATLPGNDLFDSITVNLVIQINPTTPEVIFLSGEKEKDEALSSFQYLNTFNRDAAHFSSEQPAAYQESLELLLQNETEHPLLQNNKVRWLITVFAVSDGMAIYFQDKYKRFWHHIYLWFVIAITCFGIIDLKPLIVWFYLFGLVAMLGLYKSLKRRNYEERFLDYRALAESLRVLLFWQLNGVQNRVSIKYLRKHRGILSWMRYSLMNIEKIAFLHPQSVTKPDQEAVKLTRKLWIDDQKIYFENKLKDLQPRIKWLESSAKCFFYLMLITAIVYGILLIPSWEEYVFKYLRLKKINDTDNIFQAFIGFFGALSLIAETYKTRETLEEIQKQYALLAPLYQRASEQILEGSRPASEILVDLGCEALQENGEWLWWRRHQPEGPPKG